MPLNTGAGLAAGDRMDNIRAVPYKENYAGNCGGRYASIPSGNLKEGGKSGHRTENGILWFRSVGLDCS